MMKAEHAGLTRSSTAATELTGKGSFRGIQRSPMRIAALLRSYYR